MEIDSSQSENKDSSDQKNPSQNSQRIQDLQDTLKIRSDNITALSRQLDELKQRYEEESSQYQKEQNELRQLTAGNADNENGDVTMQEVRQTSNVANADTDTNTNINTNNNRQIMTDEELARHLAAQFAREEEEEEEQEQQQQQQQEEQSSRSNPGVSQIRTVRYGDPNSGGGFSFQISSSSSNSGPETTTSGFRSSNFPMGFGGLNSFFEDDGVFASPFFARSGLGGMQFPSDTNRRSMNRNDDPFSAMRILPMSGFPGLMFGGALMNENADYETLMSLFPPVPRGAAQTDIEQLPVDTFKAKPKEKEEPEKKSAQGSNGNGDEFHKCCICLETFKEGEEIRRLPCLHIFHTDEISHWLERNHLCPICRTPIEQNEPEQASQ